jgi:transglutaminase-like putative cysteine protease
MLRRHKAARAALSFSLSVLTAYTLLTAFLNITQMLPLRFFGLIEIIVFTLIFFASSRFNSGLRPIMLIGLTVAALFAFSGGNIINAMIARIKWLPMIETSMLYSDAILAFFSFLTSLFGVLLAMGDPATSMPLYITSLMLMWYSGAKTDLKYFIPAALVLPFMFIVNRPFSESTQKNISIAKIIKAAAIAIAIALLAAAVSPEFPKTQPQLEERADALRDFINDYFFFTDSRTGFSLKAEGWQNMPDDGLGGVPNPPNAPVLEVSAEGKTWLRGAIKDHYNGRAWYDTLSDRRYGVHSGRFEPLRKELFNWNLPEQERLPQKQVKVNVLRECPSTLFVPQRVRQLDMGAHMVPYFNNASELFITRNLEPGNSYTVTYEDYSAGEETKRLANALSAHIDPNYALMQDKYTQLPKHLTPDGIVAHLASLMARDAASPYDIAENIMKSLKNNYRYTLNVQETPQDTDFVAHFLFDTMEGYCTYFASAMTVLARSQGLPARYIEGFLVKEHKDNPITLTSEDAHAWAEVYIPNIGWVVFDATADENSGDTPPDKDALNELMFNPNPPTPSPEPSPTPSPTEDTQDKPDENPTEQPSPAPSEPPAPTEEPESAAPIEQDRNPLPWLWLLALVVLLISLRLYFAAPTVKAKRLKDANAKAFALFNGFLEIMQESGNAKLQSETLIEYAKRQGDKGLISLSMKLSAITYGAKTPTAQTLNECERLYKNAFKNSAPIVKAKVILKRIPIKKEEFRKFVNLFKGFWDSFKNNN